MKSIIKYGTINTKEGDRNEKGNTTRNYEL